MAAVPSILLVHLEKMKRVIRTLDLSLLLWYVDGNKHIWKDERFMGISLKDFSIYKPPLWLNTLLEEMEERCHRELKEDSEQYKEIVEESKKLMKKCPLIEELIDNEELSEPLNFSSEDTKALSRFLFLETGRRDWEGIQMYLMGCRDTIEILRLLKII